MSHSFPSAISSKQRISMKKFKVSRHNNPFNTFTPFSLRIIEARSNSSQDFDSRVEDQQVVLQEALLRPEPSPLQRDLVNSDLKEYTQVMKNDGQNQKTKQTGSVFMRPTKKSTTFNQNVKNDFRKPLLRSNLIIPKIDETSTEATFETQSIDENGHICTIIDDFDLKPLDKESAIIILDDEEDDDDCYEYVYEEKRTGLNRLENKQTGLFSLLAENEGGKNMKKEILYTQEGSTCSDFDLSNKKNLQITGLRVSLSNNTFNKNFSYKGKTVRNNF